VAQIDYDHHVLFSNSVAEKSFYYSQTSVVAPSELEQVNARLPVDATRYLTPPNSLMLKWRSASAGDWRVSLNLGERYGRVEFYGTRCPSGATTTKESPPQTRPAFFLMDSAAAPLPQLLCSAPIPHCGKTMDSHSTAFQFFC